MQRAQRQNRNEYFTKIADFSYGLPLEAGGIHGQAEYQ
jgi:hypothetical protein